ncbi:glycosyltransferase [Laribacter hongkongensis]|uniref:glycosyltransferase n=1 Tax=Laribacter hongkongensis TaxID=168471 RepID=UPI001EFE225C|nr:glycosyltransferase [Laribacter hongkongensis]MCG9082780.1 glycosyltransferase [Laribacter hongkongensis]
MSVKRYGIYLAYAPTVDLRNEGLGRYLAAFLRGVSKREDVHFVIVCPSWSRESLARLFESEQVPHQCMEILAPDKVPVVLRLYQSWFDYRKRKRKSLRLGDLVNSLRNYKNHVVENTLHRIVTAESVGMLILRMLPIFLMVLAFLGLMPLWLVAGLVVGGGFIGRRFFKRIIKRLGKLQKRLQVVVAQPKDDGLVLRMYRVMEQHEGRRMLMLINSLREIRAWYCPTAFWPAFNDIKAPSLMCVPDVVLADFPVGFAGVGGDRFLDSFQQVENAIRGGQHFVTYSNCVKWDTLVDRYAVSPERVAVVHHAPNVLNHWVDVVGLADPAAASRNYCQHLLINAIQRSFNLVYAKSFQNRELKFLFYASQLRPNKNVLTLLRAYEHLLRKRFIGHKLIMTGNPTTFPTVHQFVKEHHLENEVLFLHGLKPQELAACYKLADLAVNPSLSEGGCPFTFTEALSVDTPVVMARIPVTEEVLMDPELQEATFFDPYDWQSLAERIEWALAHRDDLLVIQRRTYAELSRRTWADVVDEHLVVLERIAQLPEQSTDGVA